MWGYESVGRFEEIAYHPYGYQVTLPNFSLHEAYYASAHCTWKKLLTALYYPIHHTANTLHIIWNLFASALRLAAGRAVHILVHELPVAVIHRAHTIIVLTAQRHAEIFHVVVQAIDAA